MFQKVKILSILFTFSIIMSSFSFAEIPSANKNNRHNIYGNIKGEPRPTQAEMNELSAMMDKGNKIIRSRGRSFRDRRYFVGVNLRYQMLLGFIRKKNYPAALKIYESLYAEVKRFIERFEPAPPPVVINPPSRHEMRELFRKIDEARRIAREKNANQFFVQIDRVEDKAGKARRALRQNHNRVARKNYNQALTEITAILEQINQYRPPRQHIRPARNANDRPQEMYGYALSYYKNLAGNRIHARERADYHFNVNLPLNPSKVNLKIWGKRGRRMRNCLIRIRINGHKVIEAEAPFSHHKSMWMLNIPANYLKNGQNTIRIVLVRPFNPRRHVDLLGMLLEMIYTR